MDIKEYERLRKEKSYKRVIREEKRGKEIYQMLPYYENCVLLGDSIAESILDFRLLRKNNVIAKRGRCIDMIDEDIEKVFVLEPKIIYMEFGKNDILHFQGKVEPFIEIYAEKIQRIRQTLPHTCIYINSIIPMRQDVMDRLGGRKVLDAFNEGLMNMCEKYHLTFINNEILMSWKDDVFEFDGVHPKYPYYTMWMKHMASTAGVYSET